MAPIRVLVADDDAAFLELMCLHLEKREFDVERARDGLEAMQALNANAPFSVLVTDLMMPGMSGLELLRRARKLDPHLEVIVITAAGSLDMAISALREDGAFDYLTKPLELMSELSLAVERAYQHRRLRLEREALRNRVSVAGGRLQEILGSVRDPILCGNAKDEVIYANQAACDLLGTPSLAGRASIEDLPDSLRGALRAWRSLWPGQGAMVEFAGTGNHSLTLTPVVGTKGEPRGWTIQFRQVSYQRALESMIVLQFTRSLISASKALDRGQALLTEARQKIQRGGPEGEAAIRQLSGLLQETKSDLVDSLSPRAGLRANGFGDECEDLGGLLKEAAALAEQEAAAWGMKMRWRAPSEPLNGRVPTAALRVILRHFVRLGALTGRGHDGLDVRLWAKDSCLWIQNSWTHRTQAGGGSGAEMELAIVRALVRMVEGQVWQRAPSDERAMALCIPMKG